MQYGNFYYNILLGANIYLDVFDIALIVYLQVAEKIMCIYYYGFVINANWYMI